MKFLVDECVGPSVARWLAQNGYDAISIYDGLAGIDDNSVLEKALLENRIHLSPAIKILVIWFSKIKNRIVELRCYVLLTKNQPIKFLY